MSSRKLIAALAVAWLPALVGGGAVAEAAALRELAASGSPYFVPEHFALLYLATPVVVASACVLLVSPGLLVAPVLGAARSLGTWLAASVLLSCLWIALLTGVVEGLLGLTLQGSAFLLSVALLSFAIGGALLWAERRGRALEWPSLPDAGLRIALVLAGPLVVLVALLPKFLWEVFNGDGAHAYESSRLLLVQPLPFWSPDAGGIAAFPAFNSMLYAFPTSWFIRAFGELEVSARIPYLLYLGALFAGIVSLAEHGRSLRLRVAEQLLLWASLFAYSLALGYSATYSPYSADFALPATQDTLLMVCFFGAVLSFFAEQRGWLAGFVVATCASLPSGPMLFGLLGASVLVFVRPTPWRSLLVLGGSLAGWIVFSGLAAAGLAAIGHPMAEGEYGLGALLARFRFLQIADLRRLGFVLIPCGILPVLSFAAWRWHDALARTLIGVWAGYLGLFYVQAYVSLHHFLPAMLIPLVVVFRAGPLWADARRPLVIAGAALFCAVSLWLAWPTTTAIHTALRDVGASIDFRIPGYEQSSPRAFRSAGVLAAAIPLPWEADVPDAAYGASPTALLYYAHRPEAADARHAYVLQPATSPPDPSHQRLVEENGVALDLVDPQLRARQLAVRPVAPIGSPFLRVPRSTLYPGGAGPRTHRVYDVRRILRRWFGGRDR